MQRISRFDPQPTGAEASALDMLRLRVLRDPRLAERLGEIECPDRFLQTLVALLKSEGADEVATEIARSSELGPFRLGKVAAPTDLDHWPPPGWAVERSISTGSDLQFEWIWLGKKRLTEPFYEDTIRQYRNRPLNRLVRARTSLAALVGHAAAGDIRSPDGFILHMSRCGSTLLAQMLAQLHGHVVVSEAEPLDSVMRWATRDASPLQIAALQAIVKALGRTRTGNAQRLFVKLDAWHTLALPILLKAFPGVPWIFLYRDPAEVVASHAQRPGSHVAPGALPADVLAIESADLLPYHEYCALALARICRAALDHLDMGGGLLVNYCELQPQIPGRLLRHFGIELGAREAAIMAQATAYHSKTGQPFSASSCGQSALTASAKRAVETHLLNTFRCLEAARKKPR